MSIASKILNTVPISLLWAASVAAAVVLLILTMCAGFVAELALVLSLATIDACRFVALTTTKYTLSLETKTRSGAPRALLILCNWLLRFTPSDIATS